MTATVVTRRRPPWVPWVRLVLLCAGTVAAMVLGWRIALVAGDGPPMTREDPALLQPVTPLVWALVALTVTGILVARRWAAAGFVIVLAAAWAYLALGGLAVGVLPATAYAVLAGARRYGLGVGWGLVAAVGLTHVLAPASSGDPLDLRTLWGAASLTVWTALPMVINALRRGRREAAARARSEELRRATADERLRVARDIHDVVGHSLSMISLQSGVALRVLDADPAQARASLEAIRSSSKDALAELRHTLGVFRGEGAELVPTPSLAGVRTLVEDARTGGVRVDHDPVDATGVPAAVQAVAYRVVQEGLTNAIRHAPGAAVHVALSRRPGALRVTVSDTGGASPEVTEGGGLVGMRERVESLGGRLTLSPGPAGLTLTADLPWRDA